MTMFSIDRAEFDRLQTQLIELRTANYQLKEQNSKTSAELTQLQHTVQTQARDLERANKSIQRSKKAKEFSSLAEENDLLQQKLERQEEDFRLQNQTLMQELSRVCDEKEAVKDEVDRLKSEVEKGGGGGGASGGGGGAMADQMTHLQAENTALVKSMQALQDRLKGAFASNEDCKENNEVDASASQPASDNMMELELRLATGEEEKRLLQEKLAENQESFKAQVTELKESVAKLTEKAKKKQDSLLQLQEEKERQFHEHRSALDQLARTKDHEVQGLQTRIQQMSLELQTSKELSGISEEVQKEMDALKQRNEELDLSCETLKKEKEFLVREKADQDGVVRELGRELQEAKAGLGEGKKTSRDLEDQLQEAKLSQEQLADQVVKTSEEKHTVVAELEAAQKLAEKRKALLDKMSIQSQESSTEVQNKMAVLEEQHKEEVSKLEEQLQQEQSRNWKLTESLEELSVLREKSEEGRVRLGEVEAERERLEIEVQEERRGHQAAIEELTLQRERETQSLQQELEECRSTLEEREKELGTMVGKVEDKQESIRIVERKSQAMIKDLKRQVQHMQKKEEKLQDQLSALKGVQVGDILVRKEISHDTSSNHSRESSLSSVRGVLKLDSVDASTPMSGPNSIQMGGGGGVSEETQELLARVAELQKEKWALEEKVHHLESTGSVLAEDVIQKSEIIKNYFMETRADHTPNAGVVPAGGKMANMVDKLSPMKRMPWNRSSKEDTLEEINRKMQRALEEALMKNIHLQENVAMLSASLEKASTSSHSPSSPSKKPSNTAPP